MKRLRRLSIRSRRRGRHAVSICLHCAQAAAPEWPFALVWPLVRVSLASAVARLAPRK